MLIHVIKALNYVISVHVNVHHLMLYVQWGDGEGPRGPEERVRGGGRGGGGEEEGGG